MAAKARTSMCGNKYQQDVNKKKNPFHPDDLNLNKKKIHFYTQSGPIPSTLTPALTLYSVCFIGGFN